MPSDLRVVWPTLSPDRRNALVAMAMGWTLWSFDLSGTGRTTVKAYPPERERFPGDLRELGEEIPWTILAPDATWTRPLPNFCGSWEGFGQIWEASTKRGLDVWAHGWSHEHHRINVCSVLDGRGLKGEATASDVRDGFALAFVLASGVEVPAEWLPGVHR